MPSIPLTCRYCNAKMASRRGSRPQGQAACNPCRKAGRGLKHGTGNAHKKHGCRCDECRAHMTKTAQKFRDGFEARTGRSWNSTYRANYREAYGQRYWAGKSGKDWIDPALRLELYERDAFTCGLCGLPVDVDGDLNGDLAPSLDHIIPRSLGGSDDTDNLSTAHRLCNSRKGAALQEV